MGVHYFFTWVTKRYPKIKEKVINESTPVVDHLYLDINGAIHRCAKDANTIFKDMLSGKKMLEIYISIINYLNKIINIAKPKKSIYFAIDGVAPRSKIQNQRNRRFLNIYEGGQVKKFINEKVGLTPEQMDFKSNSISPGTEFMFNLKKHIEFYIQQKFAEDQNWKNLKVYFSSGNVPGEGEHKIMDHIRNWASKNEMNLRETHCIYGNDSDLVLLSLKLHLPNIFLMKEPNVFFDLERAVNFAAKRFQDKEDFEFIYTNIFREYLYLEFGTKEIIEAFENKRNKFEEGDKNNCQKFNFERVIDDFVFLSFFVGNDFLPGFYGISTKDGDLDKIMKLLKKFYVKHKCFITFRENINWKNFLILFKELLPLQDSFIKKSQRVFSKEIKFMDRKMKNKNDDNEKTKNQDEIQEDYMNEKVDLSLLRYNYEYKELSEGLQRIKKMESLKNKERKEYYYLNYLNENNNKNDLNETIQKMCFEYFKGIEYINKYYTVSCPSWTWHYNYTLCPLIDDLHSFLEKSISQNPDFGFKFEESKGFNPFVQLLHILPESSFSLLPSTFYDMIFDEKYFEEEEKILKEKLKLENDKKEKEKELEKSKKEEKCEEKKDANLEEEQNSESNIVEEKKIEKEEKDIKEVEKNNILQNSFEQKIDFSYFSIQNYKDNSAKLSVQEKLYHIQNIKNYRKTFPKSFSIKSIDSIKTYRWHPLIPEINPCEIISIVKLFPWSKLSSSDKARNSISKDILYYLSENSLCKVKPSFPGFKKFEIPLKISKFNRFDFLPVNPRKLDKLYLLREDIQELTKFKLPSYLNKFGGFDKMNVKEVIQKGRNILYFTIESEVLKELLLSSSFVDSIKNYSNIKKFDKESKSKTNVFKKKYQEYNNYEKLSFQEQNKIYEKNIEELKKSQQDLIVSLHKKQKFKVQRIFFVNWINPIQKSFLKLQFFEEKEKDEFLKIILDELYMDFFIQVKNRDILYNQIKELPYLLLSDIDFSFMKISKNNENKMNFQLTNKAGRISKFFLHEITSNPFYQVKCVSSNDFDLNPLKPDLLTGKNKKIEILDTLAIDTQTGNFIQLSQDSNLGFKRISRGESFEDIPMIKNYKILHNNFKNKNLEISPISHSEMSLLSTNILTNNLKLGRDEHWIIWLICDSLLVFMDKNDPSVLIIGTKYDIGLNFFKILNQKVNDFKIVNDMATIYLDQTFRLNNIDDVEKCINKFLKPKFEELILLFETEETNFKKSKNKEIEKFIKQKKMEIRDIKDFLFDLCGKDTILDWIEDLQDSIYYNLEKRQRRKRKSSIEIEDGRVYINENIKKDFLVETLKSKNFKIDKKGFSIWREEISTNNSFFIKMFLKYIPSIYFKSLDKNILKLFSIYFSNPGLKALKEHLAENRFLIDYLRKYKERLIKVLSYPDKEKNKKYFTIKYFPKISVLTLFRSSILKDSQTHPNILLFNCYARIIKKSHSSLLQRSALSRAYSKELIQKKITNFKTYMNKSMNDENLNSIRISDLIIKRNLKLPVFPCLIKTPQFHSLGDRVILINSCKPELLFGKVGTIIGVFKDQIEVLFDKPFMGANNINGRAPYFRGLTLDFFDVFNLSKWSSLVFRNFEKLDLNKQWSGHQDKNNLLYNLNRDLSDLKRSN